MLYRLAAVVLTLWTFGMIAGFVFTAFVNPRLIVAISLVLPSLFCGRGASA